MKKKVIKALSVMLAVVLTFTAAPLSGFVGLQLPDWLDFSVESEAAEAGVPGYSAGAAVQWALDHYNDVDSILTGQGYWTNGGDCANFVSQCVYMGGIDMQQYTWYSNGYWRIWGDFTWIRAHELYLYMVSLGGVAINNPKASDLSIGDLIFYVTRSDGKMHHSAIVVDIVNGVPVICAHSVYDSNTGEYIKYKDSNWTLGYSGSRIYAVKMYGDLCHADNPRDIDVYTAKDGDRKNLYASPSTASACVGSVMAGAATYIHVYETKNVNGELWGKTQWAGIWAWTKLSGFNKKADVQSHIPTHDFGAKEIITVPNCITDGSERQVCKRCGYTETNVLPKSGHSPGAEATCTTPQVCTLCNVILTDALGHNYEEEMKLPTCTEAAEGVYTCTRCELEYTISEQWTEYTTSVQEYNGHYYQIFNESMTWEKANEFCNSLRGHLVVINNEDEQNFLTELAADIGKDFLWTGLYSEDGSTWKWINSDEISYTNWADGEEIASSTELYAQLSDDNWYSVPNTGNEDISEYGIICEWDSYDDYPDFWKDENSGAIKAELGYLYQGKETVTSYETALDGYVQEGGTWVEQDSGTIDYVSPWPAGFSTSHSLYTTYNKTPKVASETETTKTTVSTTTKGYIYWHWCRGRTDYLLDYSRVISDVYTSEFNTFHAFYSTTAYELGDAAEPHDDGFICKNANVCTDSYWWEALNGDYTRVNTCTWTDYNKLFNYKWVDVPGYKLKENLPAELITAIDQNQTSSTYYDIVDTKNLYTYRLDALGHDMGEWYAGEVATCLKDGYDRRDCKYCDYYETKVTTAECEVVTDEAVEATCIAPGLTEGSHCAVCGETIVAQEVVEKKDHTFGEWTEVYGISCGKGGLEERICSYCGYTEQRAIENPNPDHLGPITTEIHEAGCEHLFAQGWTDYRCECCGEEWTDDFTDPLSAQWSDWTITKSPDCSQNPNIDPVENGQKRRECLLCGLSETESILAVHELVEYEILSSCTQGGSNGYKCTVCEQVWSENTDELGHDLYDDWYVVYEAKCDTAGQEKRECHRDNCDYFETRIIDATGHDYKLIESVGAKCTEQGYDYYECQNDSSHNYINYNIPAVGHKESEYQITKDADCLNDGEKIQKCERCDITLTTEIIPATGHAWDEGVIDPSSTCNTHGTKTYTCQNDSSHKYTEEAELNPDNHVGETYVKDAKESTCAEDGYTGDTYCADCNALLEEGEVIPMTGHDYGEWTTVTAPTCEENGLEQRICKNDANHKETNTLEPIGHAWDEGVIDPSSTCNTHGTKTYTCQNDSSHKYTEEVELNPDNHVGETYVKDAKESTCAEDGYTGDTYCADCNALLKEGEVIPMTDHDWNEWEVIEEPKCDKNGKKQRVCKNDETHVEDEAIIATGHSYTSFVTAPTCTEEGFTTYICDCGDSYTEDIVDALGHDWGEWYVKTPADYDVPGLEQRDCSRGDKSETRLIAPLVKNTYTATFIVADDNGDYEYEGMKWKVVDTVVFEEGATSISNPPVPELPGYIGYWENYTLANQNIVVKAKYELKSSENQSELKPHKDSVYKDGIATITLSAYADTLNAKVPMGATPYDIVLVLDQSSSMNKDFGKKKRLEVLQDVATDFVNTVYESADENNVDHRVAIVGFSSLNGTGLYTQSGSFKSFENGLGTDDYSNAFIDVRQNHNLLKNAIAGIKTKTGTSADRGLEVANQILANNQNSDRKTLVIFITDGVPTRSQSFDNSIAGEAIDYANNIKNLYDTPIYSIGVDAGADPSDESQKFNRFLHYVSSNYPDAKDIDNGGVASAHKSYFLSAEDSETLDKIFKDIFAQQIANTISFTNVSFVDTISEYFTLTIENENALRDLVKAEYGVSDDDITIIRNTDGTTTIEINNLVPKPVYDENNKQVGYGVTVVFDVTANEKTLEGGTFVTNTADAGVESNGKLVIEFEIPEKETIESGRAIVEFRVGDEVYAIREVAIGDKIIAPETDMTDWVITDGQTVTSDYTVIEAEPTSETRTVTWIVGDETITEIYHVGQIIEPVQVECEDGYIFVDWNTNVPFRMPNYDLSFTAIFAEHNHLYALESKEGNCVDGITSVYTCACGDSYSETFKSEHNYTANVQLINDESVATMICTVCGKSESKVIEYKAAYTSEGGNKNHFGFRKDEDTITNVVDINMYNNNGVSVQPDGFIYVKLRLDENAFEYAKDGTLIVKRINENNTYDNIPFLADPTENTYGYYVDGNYLVLKLDHFSYYMYTTEEFASNIPTYEQVDCAFSGHNFTDGKCTVCGEEVLVITPMTSQIRFNRNEDGSFAETFDVRTRVMISDEDFAKFVGASNEEAIENIDKIGFVYTVNGENFSEESAQAVAQGESVVGYVDAPVKYVQDAGGYYMFTCLVTGIPVHDKDYVLTAYAYICIDGEWYFSEVPMDADFSSLYEVYYPIACDKYGW